MLREEAIEFGNMWLQLNEDCKNSSTYTFFQMAIKALEQETVSKESYDHEYFLRKELEMKIAKLKHDENKVLDKIRVEIERHKIDKLKEHEDETNEKTGD